MARHVNIPALAITVGLLWGGTMFIAALTAPAGWNAAWVALWSSTYIGYTTGFGGAIIGFLWGFFDAAIIVVVGWLIYVGLAKVFDRSGAGVQGRVGRRVS